MGFGYTFTTLPYYVFPTSRFMARLNCPEWLFFYEERVSQHLKICLNTFDSMREDVTHELLHLRKLRSFDEPAFR